MSEGDPVINLGHQTGAYPYESLNTFEKNITEDKTPETSQQTYQPPVIDFEIPRNRNGNVEWKKLNQNPSQLLAYIEAEAYRVKQAGIPIRSQDLREHNLIPLYSAIWMYYPGSFLALREKFQGRKLPIVDPQTGIYTDENGKRWSTVDTVGKGKFAHAIKKGASIKTIPGMNNGRDVELVSIEDFDNFRASYLALPEVDLNTGMYVDPNGEKWVSNRTLQSRRKVLRANKDKVRTIRGKVAGSPGTLYSLEDTNKLFEERFPLPSVDPETGVFVGDDGKQWITETNANDVFGITPNQIKREKISSLKGRGISGSATNLYSRDEIIALKQERDSLPHVDRDSEEYVDNEGKRWASIGNLIPLGITSHRLNSSKTRSITGIDKGGKKAKLYDLEQVNALMSDMEVTPKVNKDSGVYIDSSGEEWTSLGNLISTNSQRQGVQDNQNIRRLTGLDRVKKTTTLFNSSDVKNFLTHDASLPRVNEEGVYVDDEGREWAITRKFGRDLGLTNLFPVYRLLSNHQFKPGWHGIKLFPHHETLDFLKQKLVNEVKNVSPDEADEMMRGLEVLP